MIGLDFLGLGSKAWPIKATIEAFPQGGALGFFGDDTFGPNAMKNVRAFIASGKVAAIRNQMHWDYGHKIIPIEKLKKALPAWEKLAKEFPGIRVYLSHSCEYSERSLAEIKKRVDLIHSLAPSCIPVQTPMRSPVISGEIVEVHGQQPAKPGQICSTDGEALFNMDAEKWNNASSGGIIRFAWGERCNGAEAHNTLPPPKREAFPDRKYTLSLLRLLEPKGIPPTPTFQAKPLKKPLLWKTHAEDNPGSSARDNRPLIMLPKKTKDVQLVTFQGEPIGKLVYFAPYPGGLFRFYSGLPGGIGLYGYEIGEKAKAKSGSEFIWIKQGNTFYGPINPAFREGYFQT